MPTSLYKYAIRSKCLALNPSFPILSVSSTGITFCLFKLIFFFLFIIDIFLSFLFSFFFSFLLFFYLFFLFFVILHHVCHVSAYKRSLPFTAESVLRCPQNNVAILVVPY